MTRPWTTTEARIARHERQRATPVRDIAARLGRTPHSIYAFLRYQHRGKAYAEALKRPCPECDAEAGELCRRPRYRGHGLRPRKNYHPERFPS